jgi:hypothetical protein
MNTERKESPPKALDSPGERPQKENIKYCNLHLLLKHIEKRLLEKRLLKMKSPDKQHQSGNVLEIENCALCLRSTES